PRYGADRGAGPGRQRHFRDRERLVGHDFSPGHTLRAVPGDDDVTLRAAQAGIARVHLHDGEARSRLGLEVGTLEHECAVVRAQLAGALRDLPESFAVNHADTPLREDHEVAVTRTALVESHVRTFPDSHAGACQLELDIGPGARHQALAFAQP